MLKIWQALRSSQSPLGSLHRHEKVKFEPVGFFTKQPPCLLWCQECLSFGSFNGTNRQCNRVSRVA